VSLVSEGFVGQARNTAAGIGLPGLTLAVVPSHPDVQTDAELAANIANTTLGMVVDGLTGAVESTQALSEPDPTVPVFEGTFDEVNRFFYENLWSDGLPIVPPTRERIDAFLAFVDRPADDVLGNALPENRAVTLRSVAVNGVMAGCRPEYMPILVALAEAMIDPAYGNEHSGNTPGAETQIVLDGPLVKRLGFNYEQGALRDGVQANTAIGRFWRLMLRNLAGFLLHQNDKGTFGGTWRVVLAENQETLDEIGWPTVAADAGVPAGASAVTVARYTGAHVVVSVFGRSAEECVPYLADALVKYTGWELIFTVGMANGTYRPMLVLSPIIARTIASSGWTKARLQEALFEQARMPARLFEQYISGWTNLVPGRRSLYDMARLGKAPRMFGASRDPERLVPIVLEPGHITIAVAGDPLRTNCYCLTHNGMLGFPTTREIVLPPDWNARLEAARDA
jgi:hypothetical protein